MRCGCFGCRKSVVVDCIIFFFSSNRGKPYNAQLNRKLSCHFITQNTLIQSKTSKYNFYRFSLDNPFWWAEAKLFWKKEKKNRNQLCINQNARRCPALTNRIKKKVITEILCLHFGLKINASIQFESFYFPFPAPSNTIPIPFDVCVCEIFFSKMFRVKYWWRRRH